MPKKKQTMRLNHPFMLALVELMDLKRFSQTQLAKQIKMSQRTVSDVLSGRNAYRKTLDKIAIGLGSTYDAMIRRGMEISVDAENRIKRDVDLYKAGIKPRQPGSMPSQYDEDIDLLAKIYISRDEELINAIHHNLRAFATSAERLRREEERDRNTAELREQMNTMQQQLQRQGLVVVERRSGEDRRKHDEHAYADERRVGGDRRKQVPGT